MALLFAIPRLLASATTSHLHALLNEFDPIKDSEPFNGPFNLNDKSRHHILNGQFMFPMALVLGTIVQSLIGLEGWPDSFDYDRIVTHKIFPQEIWLEADVAVAISAVNAVLVLLNLLFTPMLNRKCWMQVRKGNSELPVLVNAQGLLNHELSTHIYGIRRNTRRTLNWTFIIWIVIVEIYFIQQLLLKSSFTIDIQNIMFWFVVFPLYAFYTIFFDIIMVVYFIVTSRYVQLKQHSVLKHFASIQQANFTNEASEKRNDAQRRVWRQFKTVNYAAMELCHEIDGLNAFWSRYLTCFYGLDIGFIVYSVYILFLVPTIALQQKFVFVLVLSYATVSLFALILQCANVVHNNSLIDEQNRILFKYFQQPQKLNQMSSVLNAETIACNRLANSYGFRLRSNNALINSSTLYKTFYQISVFFMLNFRSI